MKDTQKFFLSYLIVFIVALVLLRTNNVKLPVPTLTSTTTSPAFPVTVSNLTPIVMTPEPNIVAIAKDNMICVAGSLNITISQFAIVSIIATNLTGEWGLVRLSEGLACWVELSHLDLNNQGLEFLPIEDFLPLPTITAASVHPTINAPSPLVLRWKILSYDCLNGRVNGAIIGLDVSGGVPDYNFSPALPIFVQPSQFVSITVKSNTSDGEPSGTISFTLPSATDISIYQCDKPGNHPGPTPLPINPTATPISVPICYDPRGKQIPCR